MKNVREFANEQRPPSEALVERVARLEKVDHTDLVTLYEAIDPDALDRLVGGATTPLQIEFCYAGHDVTVTGEGVVHIDEERPFDS